MWTILSALVAGGLALVVPVQAQVRATEIRVISPGVVYNAGLLDLAAAFEKETSTRVTVTSSGMGAVSARSSNAQTSRAFIRYITRPEVNAIWKAKGLERF